MRRERIEALVVGAGPVGLLTALLLKRSGVNVRIIDQEQQTTTRSYASALHPATLELLAHWDLTEDIVAGGNRVNTIAFYDRREWRAQVSFRELAGEFRYIVVLPQDRLEKILEKKIFAEGLRVEWNQRLSTIVVNDGNVVAQVDRLRESGKGYVIPYLDWEVESTSEITADFVVGADGLNSHVRECLNIPLNSLGPVRTFAMYEFETDRPLATEMRVVLNEGTHVFWPLPGRRCRWTFELSSPEAIGFPSKERSPFIIESEQ